MRKIFGVGLDGIVYEVFVALLASRTICGSFRGIVLEGI